MNKLTGYILATAAALMICAPAAQAQAVAYNAKATISVPMGGEGNGYFLDHKVGAGVGVAAQIPIFKAGSLVPRIDYTMYKNEDYRDAKAQYLKAGFDYDYYFSGKANKGPYAGVGVGEGSTEFQQAGRVKSNQNAAYYAAQVGTMFTKHMGAELRYTYTEYNTRSFRYQVDVPTLDASFVYRF